MIFMGLKIRVSPVRFRPSARLFRPQIAPTGVCQARQVRPSGVHTGYSAGVMR